MSKARYKKARRPGSRVTVLAHRLVMEQVLGRPLSKHEHVHHQNGDCFDNRPENLEVLSPKAHMAAHGRQKYPLSKPCQVCGAEFTPKATKRKRAKTCSRECFRRMQGAAKRGSGQPGAVLTEALVAEARRRVLSGELITLVATDIGVRAHTVANAVTGRTWAHVQNPPPFAVGYNRNHLRANVGDLARVEVAA